MRFGEFAKYLEKLEKTSSRNEITVILAGLLGRLEKGEVEKGVNLLLGQLVPTYKEVVFNIADQVMMVAIAKAFDANLDQVKTLYRKEGDLGNVVDDLAPERGKGMSVEDVYESLYKIADEGGGGSVERKVSGMSDLLSKVGKESGRFIVRITLGKLRLGFSDKTIIDALSWMEKGDKSVSGQIEQAYQTLPDIGLLAAKIRSEGWERAIKDMKAEVGVPIMPMLAQRLKSPAEMVKKMGKVAVEPKLDGLRISIHFKRGKGGFVKAFTRNMHDVAWMFPELSEVGGQLAGDALILDSEAIGVDEQRMKLVDFQATMSRRRKHQIEEFSTKVPIRFYVFDILFKDGRSLLELGYLERRKVLEGTVKGGKLLELVEYKLTEDPVVVASEYERRNREGLEGVIVKRVESGYVPGRTGWRWVKMKEAEESVGKLSDTVDCVIMGYSTGKGKRAGFGLGQFLVGVLDGEKIKTITKVGTGLSDELFVELSKRLGKLQVTEKPKEYEVDKLLEPNYWVEPEVVVEIAGDEITKSPRHTSEWAIRFPRLVKIRDDKDVRSATTVVEVEKLYRLQVRS